LKDTVSFHFIGMLFAVFFPVTGMIFGPFLLAQFLVEPVIRICLYFVTLPDRFPGSLTRWFSAKPLIFMSWAGGK